MGKKEGITLLVCLLSISLFGQKTDDSTFVRPGLVRTFGCFAFDYRPHQNAWDYRLHGFVEYFPEKRISAMGEIYYYLDSSTDFPVISKNFSVGTGFGYHWSKKRLNPYVFVMAIGNFYESQIMTDSLGVLKDKITTEASPGVAFGGGLNLYVWKYINFFVQLRYHHTFIYSPIQITKMDALSVSYGLGFNFQTRKKNKEP